MYSYLLPIGSVVTIKDAKKAMMIVGYLRGTEDGTVFDYIAVTYPEGFVDARLQIVFNHSDIKEIVYKGYADDKGERDVFIRYLAYRKEQSQRSDDKKTENG